MGTLTPRDRAAYLLATGANKTGFIGVTFKRRTKMFEARIRVPDRKEKVYCGCGRTAAEAARHYDAKARELFGSSAVVNFPIEEAEGQ